MAYQAYQVATGGAADYPQRAPVPVDSDDYTLPTHAAARRLRMTRNLLRHRVAMGQISVVRRAGRLWFSEREVAALRPREWVPGPTLARPAAGLPVTEATALAVVHSVSARTGFAVAAMAGRVRSAALVTARAQAARELRDLDFTLEEIGRVLGGRHHTTIMNMLESLAIGRPESDEVACDGCGARFLSAGATLCPACIERWHADKTCVECGAGLSGHQPAARCRVCAKRRWHRSKAS